METLHGLPTYVARPQDGAEPVGVVVIVADAFGWELLNSRALADAYARRGPFLVYMPDFFGGESVPALTCPLRRMWKRLPTRTTRLRSALESTHRGGSCRSTVAVLAHHAVLEAAMAHSLHSRHGDAALEVPRQRDPTTNPNLLPRAADHAQRAGHALKG